MRQARKTILGLAALGLAASAAYVLWLPDVRGLKTHNPRTTAFVALAERRARRHNPAERGRYVERNTRRVLARMKESGYLPDEFTVLPSTAS